MGIRGTSMQSRFVALLSGLAVVAASLAVIAVSHNSASPAARLGILRPMLAVGRPDGEVGLAPVNSMMRAGPEYLSPNPQMQMLSCFGICGAQCQEYCKNNWLMCTKNSPNDAGLIFVQNPNEWMEPSPGGGGDHVNWCRRELDRCEGLCS